MMSSLLNLLKKLLPAPVVERTRIFLLRTNLHRFIIPYCDSKRLNQKISHLFEHPQTIENFRQNEEIRELCENETIEQGIRYRTYTLQNYSNIYKKYFENIKESHIGNPKIIDEFHFSPNTESHLYKSCQILYYFNDLKGKNIVEIGGGYGGLARIICESIEINSYTIIDIPQMQRVQKFYLENSLNASTYKKISYIDAFDNHLLQLKHDWHLAISTFALSEQSINVQKNYLTSVINNSENVYLINNVIFSKNLSKKDFINTVSKTFTLIAPIEMDPFVKTHNNNYQLIGNKIYQRH